MHQIQTHQDEILNFPIHFSFIHTDDSLVSFKYFIALVFFNASCSGGFSSGGIASSVSYSSLTGRASAGPIASGTVKIYKAESDGSRGSLITTTTTDSNGNYTVNVPSTTGSVLVVVTGGSYTEEASGSTVNLGATEITAMVSSTSADKTVSVTPLTHLAAERAATLASGGSDIATAISTANVAIAAAAGLSSTDITAVLPALPGQSLASQGYASSSSEAKYALFLAALSQYGSDNGGVNSLSVMSTFANDFKADGKFNATGTEWSSGVASAQTNYIANPNNSAFTGASATTPVNTPAPPTPTTPWSGVILSGTANRTTVGGAGVASDSDGNVYVAGYTDGNLDSSTYLGIQAMHSMVTKYNASGVKQWTRLLPSTGASVSIAAYGLAVDGGGNVFVVGTSTGPIAGSTAANGGAFVVKYNSAGVKQWSQQIDAVAWGCKVAVDSSGNVIMAGVTWEALHGNTQTGYVDIFLMKFNSSGTRQWTKQFGPTSPASANMDILAGGGVATDASDNIFVAATTEADMTGNGMIGTNDTIVAKYNSSGTQQWLKEFGATSADSIASAITTDASGNVIVTGRTGGNFNGETKTGGLNHYVMKLTSSGVASWTKLLGEVGADAMGGGVAVDANANVFVSGLVGGAGLSGLTLTGNSDLFLAKYNSSGTLQWTRQLGTAAHDVTPYGVTVDPSGNIFVGGVTNGNVSSSTLNGTVDAFVAKYNSSGTLQ